MVHLAQVYHRTALWQLSVTERALRSRLTRIEAQRGAETKPCPPNTTFRKRLAEHAARLREEAKALPPGKVRDAVLRRAEQAQVHAAFR